MCHFVTTVHRFCVDVAGGYTQRYTLRDGVDAQRAAHRSSRSANFAAIIADADDPKLQESLQVNKKDGYTV